MKYIFEHCNKIHVKRNMRSFLLVRFLIKFIVVSQKSQICNESRDTTLFRGKARINDLYRPVVKSDISLYGMKTLDALYFIGN